MDPRIVDQFLTASLKKHSLAVKKDDLAIADELQLVDGPSIGHMFSQPIDG